MDCSLPGSSVHEVSSGKNTGTGYHALLQGIIPTQGSIPCLPNCWQILYHLNHQGSPTYIQFLLLPCFFLPPLWQNKCRFAQNQFTCSAEDTGSIPGSGRFPWKRAWQPTLVLFLRNPMDRGPWQATVHGVAKESDST